MLAREAAADQLLAELPSLVTPHGVLALEAYDSANDWLALDRLAPHLMHLGVGQAHWFSAPEPKALGPRGRLLLTSGKLVLHQDPLSEWIRWALDRGLLEVAAVTGEPTDGISLTLRRGKRRFFTLTEWHKWTYGLPVLDDSVTATPEPVASEDDRFQLFRQFLYDSGLRNMPRWEDYAHGFAFHRIEFEELLRQARDLLSEPSLKPDPVLLCGQSGSGKTVALAELAYSLRGEHWPVLYLGRGQPRVDFQRIGAACEEIERLEPTCTLIVWDSLQEPGEYAALAQHLAGRGRKALVVGSAYQADSRYPAVTFPAELSPKERQDFVRHLQSFGVPLVPEDVEEVDSHFFVFLYRLLPDARSKLRQGLPPEFQYGLQQVQRLVREARNTEPLSRPSEGWFIDRLREAYPEWRKVFGSLDGAVCVEPETRDRQRTEELTRMILVPGRYDLDVPVDLLIRCLGEDGFERLREFDPQDFGVFRWVDDDDGNPVLRVRSSLEADLLCQGDFVTPEGEIAILRRLVTQIRLGDWERPNLEVDFVTDLFVKIEPEGEYGHRFKHRLGALVQVSQIPRRFASGPAGEIPPGESIVERCWRPGSPAEVSLTLFG